MSTIKIDDIKQELAQYNWELLSDSYKNLNQELSFKCDRGHQLFSTWKKIREHRICPVCQQEHYLNLMNNVAPKEDKTVRLIALDQSTHITGYSIFDNQTLISYGIFQTRSRDEIARDTEVKRWLVKMIDAWKPDIIAIEDIQLQQQGGKTKTDDSDNIFGLTTFKMLAKLQGILLNTIYELGLDSIICAPSVWRKYSGIGGKQRADKKQETREFVLKYLNQDVSEDEADAICIGRYAASTLVESTVEDWE